MSNCSQSSSPTIPCCASIPLLMLSLKSATLFSPLFTFTVPTHSPTSCLIVFFFLNRNSLTSFFKKVDWAHTIVFLLSPKPQKWQKRKKRVSSKTIPRNVQRIRSTEEFLKSWKQTGWDLTLAPSSRTTAKNALHMSLNVHTTIYITKVGTASEALMPRGREDLE